MNFNLFLNPSLERTEKFKDRDESETWNKKYCKEDVGRRIQWGIGESRREENVGRRE